MYYTARTDYVYKAEILKYDKNGKYKNINIVLLTL